MKILLPACLCILFCSSVLADGNGIVPDKDAGIKLVFAKYQEALQKHDRQFPQKSFITDEEYSQLLQYVSKIDQKCIGEDEASFRSDINTAAYNDVITSKLVVNQITVNRIEYNLSCSGLLEIPRVICSVRYSDKKVVEVPFLLVKTRNNEYKILRNFLNYKIFSNE